MREDIRELFFGLIASAVGTGRLDEEKKALFSREMIPELVGLAGRNDIAALLATALIDNGLVAADSRGAQGEVAKAVYRFEILKRELQATTDALEAAGIPHIALKGAVIRELYPKPYLRTSGDIDVLVKHSDFERAERILIAELGYAQVARSTHDVSLEAPSGGKVELHFDLVEEGRAAKAADVLGRIWENSTVAEGYAYRCEMSDAAFYFYHIAHMAKHLEEGGCGLRPFIDLLLLDRLSGADISARRELLASGGLLSFADRMSEASAAWFSSGKSTELTDRVLEYVLNGGTYGSVENRVSVKKRSGRSRIGYIFSRIFAPYDKLCRYYPILKRHPWLTPVMQVRRWFMVFDPSVAKLVQGELRANGSLSENEAKLMEDFFRDIGL